MEKEFKYIEKIDSIENESIYIKKCFTAMHTLAVKPHLIKNIADENGSILERNYILSMVYNMGKTDYRYNTEIILGSSSYLVGGETNKYISLKEIKERKTCTDLRFAIKDDKIEVIPDLVIHDSHNPDSGNSGEGQYLVMEAKTSRKLGEYYFMRDFFKLNAYLAGLYFQNAVYLVINKSANTIDDYIAAYKKKEYYWCDHVKCKLYFFIQEKDTPELYKLR